VQKNATLEHEIPDLEERVHGGVEKLLGHVVLIKSEDT
jgi:hypothetical protein